MNTAKESRNRAQDMMVADPDRAAAKGIAPPDRNDASGLRIKERVFGCGGPIICVPVVEKTKEGILACVRDMVEQQVEMIEWRMDWFEGYQDPSAVEEILRELAETMEKTVLLCTFRSRSQGGEGVLSPEEYVRLNLAAARTRVPDLLDLEFYETPHPGEVIKQLQKEGVKVVASHHDFAKTPAISVMAGYLEEMQEAGADFAKLAVMPKNKTDVLHLLEAVLSVKERHPESHLIAMSMGGEGVLSRLLGQWYASEVTFAAFSKASAPGQIPYETAAGLLHELGRWIS